MLYVSYLRDLASHYQELAKRELGRPGDARNSAADSTSEAAKAAEYLELAEACGEIAAEMEDSEPSG
jgi:hypothetical protein